MDRASILVNRQEPFEQNLVSPNPSKLNMKYHCHWPWGYRADVFENVNSCDLETQRSRSPIDLNIDIFQYSWLIGICAKYDTSVFISPWEIDFSIFFKYKCIEMSIWPCRKKISCQLRIIIWTNLVGHKSQILHPRFQGPIFLGSDEKDSQRVFTIHQHGGHLGQVTQTLRTK